MTDWKALCAELADRLDDALTYTVQSDTERSMRQLIARTRAELAQPEWPVQDDKTLKSIRETTPRYRMSVIVRTNDSAIDTRMIVIWKALDLSNEILESISLPERLPPFLYSPVTIAECAGGPCQQGPEYCDCGAIP
jgi:hypothetical protein